MSSVKDFILHDPIEEVNQSIAKQAKTSKPKVEYETVFASGIDFAVRRKTSRTSQVLVAIVSQDQFYIKNESDGGTIDQLNVDRLKKFTGALEDSYRLQDKDGNTPTWVKCIFKGSEWAEGFMDCCRNPALKRYMKASMFVVDYLADLSFSTAHICRREENEVEFQRKKVAFDVLTETVPRKTVAEAMSHLGDLYRSNRRNDMEYKKSISVFAQLFYHQATNNAVNGKVYTSAYEEIGKRWGVEGVRTFIRAFMASPVQVFPGLSHITDLFFRHDILKGARYQEPITWAETEFALQNMVDYMFFSCAEQGYADDADNFWSLWNDYLNAQFSLFGKVQCKYSDTLATSEGIMAYRIRQMRQKVDAELWEKAVERMKPFEANIGEYKIICPKTQDDLVEEGRQMAHCVGNYGPSLTSGAVFGIYFLRRASDMDKSLVTIEIRSDGSLGQVRARFNRQPLSEHEKIVYRWYQDVVQKKMIA